MRVILIFIAAVSFQSGAAQNNTNILALAREVITTARYGALITVDSAGQARSRIVDAFAPDENFIIYVATNPLTRKVKQIRSNSKVTLFYFDTEGKNYVSIMGTAKLVEDRATKIEMRRKADSNKIYPNFPEDYLLIRIEPLWLEGLLPGYRGDPVTWEPVKHIF